MFERYFEQTEHYFRPMNEIWALQVQAAESMARTNSSLVSELWRGGLTLAQSLPAQKGLDDALELHQKFWEGFSERMKHAAGENQTLLTDVNQKIADVMQSKAGAGSAQATPVQKTGVQASPRVVTEAAGNALKDVTPEASGKSGEAKKSAARGNGSESGKSSAKASADNKPGTASKAANKSGQTGAAKSTSMAKNAENMAKSAESTAKSAGSAASAKSANAGKGADSKASGPTPAKTDNSKPQSTQPGKAGSH